MNYRVLDGNRLECELLRVWAHKGYPLHSYLKRAPKWNHDCCWGDYPSRSSSKVLQPNQSIPIQDQPLWVSRKSPESTDQLLMYVSTSLWCSGPFADSTLHRSIWLRLQAPGVRLCSLLPPLPRLPSRPTAMIAVLVRND